MYFALMGRLNARRKNIVEQDDKGFTLIELLVVVIIIGILAAIAIPVYLGVQNNAKDSNVQSDLTNAKTAIVSIQTNTNAIPSTTSDISTISGIANAGYTRGTNTGPIALQSTTSAFCLSAKSSTGTVFFATDSTGVTKVTSTVTLPGTCTTPVGP